MCEKCIKKFKNKGGIKKAKAFQTYGQLKARAQSFKKHSIVGVLVDGQSNLGIEAHMEKINKAIKQTKYKVRKNAPRKEDYA